MHNIIETLENRRLLSAVYPSDVEQLEVELINRARANPAAEATRDGVDLNEGLAANTITTAAKQPLAINPNLTDSARKHSSWMIAHDTFAHYEGSPGNSLYDPGDRAATAGYAFTGSYGWGENIGYRSIKPTVPNAADFAAKVHKDLFVDDDYPERGHRTNMMNATFREIGAGVATGDFETYNAVMVSTDFAYAGSSVFLTGVAFKDDVTKDNFYSVGEGLAGITVTATPVGGGTAISTTTWSSGGYSLALTPGTYTITGSGAALGGTVTYPNVTVASQNVKKDFVAGTSPVTQPKGSIAGLTLNDTNANGTRNSNDPALGKVSLFLDTNKNGKRDANETALTSGSSGGTFRFTNLAAGTYRVAEITPAGFRLSYPSKGYFDVVVGADQQVTDVNFANTQRPLISGTIVNTATNTGLAGWRVFVDLDDDNRYDANEKTTLTDAKGNWKFTDLAWGTHKIRFVLQPGFGRTTASVLVVTTPMGSTTTNKIFGVKPI